MKKMTRLLAVLLAMVMVLSLAACGQSQSTPTAAATTPSTEAAPAATEAASNSDTPLVVGYAPFNSKFSPFFAETAYDLDVATMTALALLNSDRTGAIIYKGIEGETIPYNGTDYTYYGPADLVVTENADGTVFYDFTLRDDLVFSDGTPITIDDVIFSMYVLCDPTYDGSSTLYAQPIQGMTEYRSGMSSLFSLIVAAGRDNTDFTYWTEDQQTALWADIDQAGAAFAQEIVDYCAAAGYAKSAEDVAGGAAAWGYDGLAADATAADFFAMMVEAYGGDLATLSDTETAGSSLYALMENYDAYTVGVQTG